MPMRLDDGWNQIQFNLSDFTRRAYGTNYIETLRVQVQPVDFAAFYLYLKKKMDFNKVLHGFYGSSLLFATFTVCFQDF